MTNFGMIAAIFYQLVTKHLCGKRLRE